MNREAGEEGAQVKKYKNSRHISVVLPIPENHDLLLVAQKKGISKNTAMRQALQLLVHHEAQASAGFSLCWENRATGRIEHTVFVAAGGVS